MAAVAPTSAAEVAAIKPGDVIVAVDGNATTNSERAAFLLRSSAKPRVELSLNQVDGRARVVDVELTVFQATPGAFLRQRLGRSEDVATRYLYARNGSPAVALDTANQILATAPGFAPAHAMRASALLQTAPLTPDRKLSPELRSDALGSAQKAIDLDPQSSEVKAEAAAVYLALGQIPEAEAAARAAVDLGPESARAHGTLGSILLASGRADAALPELHRATQLDPYAPQGYRALARGYSAVGKEDAAAATIATLEQMQSSQPAVRPARWGPRARNVLATLALAVVAVGVPLFFWRREPPEPGEPGEAIDDAIEPDDEPAALPDEPASGSGKAISLVELLAVLGTWAAILPLVSPGLGLAPETTRRLEIADHVVPGIVTAVVAVVALVALLAPSTRRDLLMLIPAATFLTGFWMTATHVPLLLQAVRHERPWSLALFHSSAGPPILALSVMLLWSLNRAGKRPDVATSAEAASHKTMKATDLGPAEA